MMRLFIKTTLIIIASCVLLMVAAIQLISTDDIFKQVSHQVEQTTGRVLAVDGEKELSFFPSLSLVLNQVRFANFEQGSREDMITVAKLHIHIPWLSALSGDLNIDKFVIVDPDILLEKNAQGIGNWQFSFANSEEVSSSKGESSDNVGTNSVSGSALPEGFDISLGQVEIKGGKLTFIDKQHNKKEVVDQLSLQVLLSSLKEPLSVSGQVRYLSQTFELNSSITTPAKVISNQDFSIKLLLESALVNVNYAGDILSQGKEVKGQLSIAGESVKQLLAWQNIPLSAKQEAFNQFSLTSDIHFHENKLSLIQLKSELDKLIFSGSAALTLTEPMMIEADFDLGTLDLNPYLPQASPGQAAATKAESNNGKPNGENQSQPISWDNSALDLSILSAVNAKLAISSDKLFFNEIKLAENKLTFNLRDGEADIKLLDFQAYDGSGTGAIKLNANKKPYQISSQFELKNISAEPLLTDAAGYDKLLGKGQLGWNLTTQGVSQRDFIQKLNGSLNFSFVDGAIKGVNLAAIAKSASNIMAGNIGAVNLDSNFNNAEKTDFASLTGTFSVKNGVASTSNIALNNPFVRVLGTGDVDLPKTKLNLKVNTKMVASAQGQAADEKSSGVNIPINITGPFHQVKIRPDISAGTKDKIKDKVKSKLKKLFG